MCGLAGFFTLSQGFECRDGEVVLRSMADQLVHRGPDSHGFWTDSASGIGLVHRRLRILDLSPSGAQPMSSASGRYVVAFNGEIYNHDILRSRLKAAGNASLSWRGNSDTETLLACIDAWGLIGTLNCAIGMFAIALWDRESKTLTLARDRLGEKPMYYGWQGFGQDKTFLFGSEMSALRRHPSFAAEINRDALALHLKHGCIGGANSIFKGIHKLLPGHLLTVSLASPEPSLHSWWSGSDIALESMARPFTGSPDEAVNSLETLLHDAVSLQMKADVPLGAFLSGGVDSSTIVAIMQSQSTKPIRTFSIGFNESSYDEAKNASAVANHLGTDHTELYVTAEMALGVIPNLPRLFSEPFADSSQIPTFLVSKLARQDVSVALSGDGGDELFCGYNRYQMTAKLWGSLASMPRPFRRLVSTFLSSVPLPFWNLLGNAVSMRRLGEQLYKGATLLGSSSADDLYDGMVSHWADPENIVLGTSEPLASFRGQANLSGLGDVERMMALDMLNYLPDDILVKVDRAAMGVSLETRVPLLDHRVVEFAWALPMQYKLRDGVSKWPLRQVLYRYVPRELIERPKMGFGVPIAHWLRGPLRDWAETLLAERRLRSEGFFDPAPIRQKWAEHLSGQRNWQSHLWDVLMFQAWLSEQHD